MGSQEDVKHLEDCSVSKSVVLFIYVLFLLYQLLHLVDWLTEWVTNHHVIK